MDGRHAFWGLRRNDIDADDAPARFRSFNRNLRPGTWRITLSYPLAGSFIVGGCVETYKIHYRLALFEYFVLCVDLELRISYCSRRSKYQVASSHTSKSLKAALLFSPSSFALRANESLPCLLFHLVEEEEEGRAFGGIEIRGVVILAAPAAPLIAKHRAVQPDPLDMVLFNACTACWEIM